MNYYVMLYDQRHQRLVFIEPFDGAGEAALARRFELEIEHRDQPELEVVVLSGESESAIRRTHSRYFKSVSQLAFAG